VSSSDRQIVDSEREAMSPDGVASPPPEAALEVDAPVEAGAEGAAGAEVDTQAATGPDATDPDAETDLEAAEAEPVERDPEAELREQAGRYLDLAQRTQADFDNYRKRMAREVRAAESRGIGKLARELLPALDNLERALAAVELADPEHQMTAGLRLVTKELSAALGRTGVEGYDPTGEQFDPNQHEAVAQHEVEGTEPGTVVQVLQSGYRLNEAILRPARVIVAS
jgi:molecular chaperone GrpE